jgi:hypothetical protein
VLGPRSTTRSRFPLPTRRSVAASRSTSAVVRLTTSTARARYR